MKMPWSKTVRGKRDSQLILVDSRDHPGYESWILMSSGIHGRSFARVALTRKGLVALRDACTKAIELDKRPPR